MRTALAERLGVEPERIVLGNGAAELLQAAAMVLLGRDDELAMPWPSYPLYPLMAARAGAKPVAVDGPDDLAGAVTPRTRAIAICNPNDPTGEYWPSARLAALLADLPEGVHVLLDEALVHFQDAEDRDACLRLTGEHPNLTVFRTFSKIYGLSGLRAGYAVGGSTELLDAIAPVLGVNALTQSAVVQALKIGGPEVERRREAVLRERARLHGRPGRPAGRRHRQPGQLRLARRSRHVGRRAREPPARARRDRGPRRPAGSGRPRPRDDP